MKLNKCAKCKKYTLKEECPTCKEKTKSAHYKFIKIKAFENKISWIKSK